MSVSRIAAEPSRLLKRLLVVFWAMYFSLVAVTNLVDLLGQFSALHWTFLNSMNFSYIRSVVKVYHVGAVPTKVLLTGALIVEATGAALFWRAAVERRARAALQALCFGALVWIAFIFMTEFFVAYAAEPPFRELLTLTIASAVFIAVAPDSIQQ
jgi:hypothetical protein